MTARPVEWILVIFYGPSAHRATYGRLGGTHYTKDYIQLSRKSEFIDALTNLFPAPDGAVSFPLTYEWPTGSTPGEIVFRSADRPHLKWETSLGAPRAWRMSPVPTKASAETIPGDPTHLSFSGAEGELTLLKSRGAGQPYLMAIKLRDEPQKLHLRAYLANPNEHFTWADAQLTPPRYSSSPYEDIAAISVSLVYGSKRWNGTYRKGERRGGASGRIRRFSVDD